MRTVYTSAAVTITRPANTDAYVIKDAIGAAALEFAPMAHYEDRGSGIITGLTLTDSSIVATGLEASLELFTAAPTVPADGAVFAPTDAEIAASFLGTIPIPLTSRKEYSINTSYTVEGLGLSYELAANTRIIYGVLVARNAYVPESGEVFTLRLKSIVDV